MMNVLILFPLIHPDQFQTKTFIFIHLFFGQPHLISTYDTDCRSYCSTIFSIEMNVHNLYIFFFNFVYFSGTLP